MSSPQGPLLFVPPEADGSDTLQVAEILPSVEAVTAEVFSAAPAVTLPRCDVAAIVAEIHCAAHRVAVEQLQVSSVAAHITPLTPCMAEDTLPYHCCTLLRRIWMQRREELRVACGLVRAAQRALLTTADEAHQWTLELRALELKGGEVLGSCLLAAAACCYGALLLNPWRQAALREWSAALQRRSIAHGFSSLGAFMGPSPCGWGLDRCAHEAAAAVCAAEEHAERWPVIVDPFGTMRGWLARRGWQSVGSGDANEAFRLVRAAAISGREVVWEGDPRALLAAVWRPLLSYRRVLSASDGPARPSVRMGEADVTPAPGFRFCALIGPGPHVLPPALAPLTSVVHVVPDASGLCELLLGEITSVVHPQLEDAHLRTQQGLAAAEAALGEAEREVQRAVTALAQPSGERMQQLRRQRDRRAQAKSMLVDRAQDLQLQRAYFFPVAVRAVTLHRAVSIERAHAGEPAADASCPWLSSHQFVAALRAALRAHLTRPPTFAADTDQVAAAVHALTAAAIHHGERAAESGGLSAPGATLPLSPSILRATSLEQRLREPMPATRDACTMAHNITASLLARPGLRAPALLRAHRLLQLGQLPEMEWDALLLHHPPREVDEVELCERYKRALALLEAERRVLAAAPGPDAGVAAFVDYHHRAEQIAARLPEQLADCDELAVLCLWAGSTHCTRQLHDKPALRVYAAELSRLMGAVHAAVQSAAASEVQLAPAVIAALNDEAAAVQRAAETLFSEVAGDVAAQLVFDLGPHLQRLQKLQQQAAQVTQRQAVLSVAVADFSLLELTAELLRSVNYHPTDGVDGSKLADDDAPPPVTLVPVPVGPPANGPTPPPGKQTDEMIAFGTVCGDTEALSDADRNRLYHNELFHRM